MTYTELITLVGSIMGFNPTTPIGWSTDEVEFAVNRALKRISKYYGDWVAETTLSLTDATDTYLLPADLKKVTRWSYQDDSHKYYMIDRGQLPTDGREGQPEYAAIEKSAAADPTRKALVFYPAPDTTYTVYVTYQYVPTADKDNPSVAIPVPDDLIEAVVMFTCYFLAAKSTVEKSEFDQENFKRQAMECINETADLEVNDEYNYLNGYL